MSGAKTKRRPDRKVTWLEEVAAKLAEVKKVLGWDSGVAGRSALVRVKDWLEDLYDAAKKSEENDGRRKVFIMELAEFIAGNQARKSIELQMGKESAKEWAKLRGASPVFGYGTVDEAYEVLLDFLK